MADVELSDDPAQFRADVAEWLAAHVVGEYAELKGRGGPGDEDIGFDVREPLCCLQGRTVERQIPGCAVGCSPVVWDGKPR